MKPTETEECVPNNIFVPLLLAGMMFIVGIGNGIFSHVWSCDSAYLDFRKPIHYILFPHTAGFYLGRALSYPYGEDKSYSLCENIFNHTLKGPKE